VRSKRLILALSLLFVPAPLLAAAAKAPVHKAAAPIAHAPSMFVLEESMSFAQRMNRWQPLLMKASKRFSVPIEWLRAVMQLESGGRTMLAENKPIISNMGAMGLMQLMPATYQNMRAQYGLGRDPYDPHDNIFAAAAYLRWLKDKYGYPNMFAAYNDGPRNLEARMYDARMLPVETQNYLSRIVEKTSLEGPRTQNLVKFSRPGGAPLWIDINAGSPVLVVAVTPGRFPPGTHAVVRVGRRKQGVAEDVATAEGLIAGHVVPGQSFVRDAALSPAPGSGFISGILP
jgi:membrane-bound lytic murein transglycosylase B